MIPPVEAAKAAKQTKQERVYEAIRERITNGSYGPGFRVVIDAIAVEFSVSALPVREAIRRLEAEGLVIYLPNAGARVAPVEPELFEEQMAVLAVLEGYATALAVPLLGPDELQRLDTITAEMVEAMEAMDVLAFGRLNQAFHEVFYEHCPNPSLVRMVRDVNDRLAVIRQTVFVQIPYRGRASLKEHRALIALIRGAAPSSEIEAAAREHKLQTVAAFREWNEAHRSE